MFLVDFERVRLDTELELGGFVRNRERVEWRVVAVVWSESA